jgi:hypothetical protein
VRPRYHGSSHFPFDAVSRFYNERRPLAIGHSPLRVARRFRVKRRQPIRGSPQTASRTAWTSHGATAWQRSRGPSRHDRRWPRGRAFLPDVRERGRPPTRFQDIRSPE